MKPFPSLPHVVSKHEPPFANVCLSIKQGGRRRASGRLASSRVASLFDAIEGRKGCVLLTEQGRTHPKILAPLNHYVYQDMLTSRAVTEYAPPIGHLPDCPLMVVDSSSSSDSKTHKPHPKEARVNDHHIDVVVALVPQIVAMLPERSPLADPSVPRIGVLVPYRSQSRRMLRALRKANLAKYVHVGTIHTAQALEFEVVILDTVEAPGYEPFEFTCDLMLDGRGMATGATRLLTVGHGRAKCKLIYIAHVTHLRLHEQKRNPKNDPHKQSLLIGLVNWVYHEGRISSAEVLDMIVVNRLKVRPKVSVNSLCVEPSPQK